MRGTGANKPLPGKPNPGELATAATIATKQTEANWRILGATLEALLDAATNPRPYRLPGCLALLAELLGPASMPERFWGPYRHRRRPWLHR